MTCSLEQGTFSHQAPPAHWPAVSQQRVPCSEILKLKIVKVKFKTSKIQAICLEGTGWLQSSDDKGT